MNVAVIPLVSKLHDERAWKPVLETYLRNIPKEVKIYETLDSPSHVFRVKENIVFLIHLTGGTSRIAKKFFDVNSDKVITLVAYGFQNSLPSAVSAYSYIRDRGGNVILEFTNDISELVDLALKASQIKKGKVVVFTGKTVAEASLLEEKLGIKVLTVPWSEVVKAKPSEKIVELLSTKLGSKVAEKISILYSGIREKLSGTLGGAVECFDFLAKNGYTPCVPLAVLNSEGIPVACEADLYSLVLLIVVKEAGATGWMANLTAVEDNTVIFSHCTGPLNLLNGVKFISHFESGKPKAVTGKLKLRRIVFGRFNNDFTLARFYSGEIVDSGLLNDRRCRIQAIIRTDNRKLLETVLGNHHVLFDAKAFKNVERLLRMLGVKVEVYGL